MDNNTLLTLVCILIAVIALLVGISLFFIYRLEEKNARQRHVIDVLLSTIKKLKVQNDRYRDTPIYSSCCSMLGQVSEIMPILCVRQSVANTSVIPG